MKRLFLAVSLGVFTQGLLNAQDLESIKTQVLLRQYKAAKPVIDKASASEKLAKKPETWALRSSIYSSLSEDSSTAKDQVESLRNEAVTAFNKYKELDPKFTLMKENSYTGGPIILYTHSLKKGIEDYNKGIKEKDSLARRQNWSDAYKNFVSAVDYGGFLYETKITTMNLDTTSLLYAGASAQNLKDDDNAAKYFTKLTDAKVAGKDYQFLYEFLANYYMGKKDEANFAKYIAEGKQMYPEAKYFPALEEDYANSKDEYYNNLRTGSDIFAKLYPKEEKDYPQGDLTEMETKMVAAFTKSAELKPEKAGMSYTEIGNHYYNKAVGVNKKILAISDAMKAMNKNAKPDKNGKLPPLPKDSIAKKEAYFKEYDGYTDQAIAAYEKAADAFSKKGLKALDNIEKQNYKNSVSFLIDLNAEKKNATLKSKPAESAKYAASEKKWSDVYSSIK